jgi:LacI family transcriptional regulator/LacI family repressor for deo operon, udp, cdd, tsx, nupC, and nupG
MGDVAQQAGVSKATVSAVLNGTGAVKGSTRERVLEAIALLNYRAAPAPPPAKAPAGRGLGIVVKELENPYYAEIVSGVRTVADQHGYSLLVASSEGDYEAERRAIELLRAKDIDGLLVTPVLHEHVDLSHLFELKRRNFPFVLLEEVLGIHASLVDIDNTDAARLAADHLIRMGHTRIVHLAGPQYSMHSRQRADGVRRACSSSHLVFGDDHVIDAGAHLTDGHRAGLAYFGAAAPEYRATAVVCYNDLVAIGLCRALNELGLRVPDDVAIVGFDDIPLLEYFPVPLTSVRIPTRRMGELAAVMLLDHVNAHAVAPPQRTVLEAELVVRASTQPVAASAGRRRRAKGSRVIEPLAPQS